MGTNECSQPASKSSRDSQDLDDVNMVLKMAHFHKSARPQRVNHIHSNRCLYKHNPIWNDAHRYTGELSPTMQQRITDRIDLVTMSQMNWYSDLNQYTEWIAYTGGVEK